MLALGVGLGRGFKLTALLVAATPVAPVAGCSVAVGVKALLEYLSAVPHSPGTLEWMSAIKAAATASDSRLG